MVELHKCSQNEAMFDGPMIITFATLAIRRSQSNLLYSQKIRKQIINVENVN